MRLSRWMKAGAQRETVESVLRRSYARQLTDKLRKSNCKEVRARSTSTLELGKQRDIVDLHHSSLVDTEYFICHFPITV